MFCRKINLERAAPDLGAADLGQVLQGLILMVLIGLPFAALMAPEATLWAVHPVSFVLPLVLVVGLANRGVRQTPMGRPCSPAQPAQASLTRSNPRARAARVSCSLPSRGS